MQLAEATVSFTPGHVAPVLGIIPDGCAHLSSYELVTSDPLLSKHRMAEDLELGSWSGGNCAASPGGQGASFPGG